MSNDLMRFSVAMPEDLLVRFDRLVARRGLAKNRSEVVRDLVRDALVERGHPPALCTVIHNGIDLPRWTKGQPWEARENAIVMPARFARQKDYAKGSYLFQRKTYLQLDRR